MAVTKLGDVAVRTIVKLNVNNIPRNFIIVQQGNPDPSLYDTSCDDTWILMEDIFDTRFWREDKLSDGNDYTLSSIDSWLNNASTGFFSLLDADIKNVVKLVKIPYRPGAGNGTNVSVGANGLSRKVFLLSINETYGNPYDAKEGVTLTFFQNKEDNIAKYNGQDWPWWTRTSAQNGGGDAWVVYDDGNMASNNIQGHYHGSRPAMILPRDLYVNDEGFIVLNSPPTAPGSIDVSGVVKGGEAAITLTAATDHDGTISSYLYERSVDGGEFQPFATANALTTTDIVNEDWGTVAYRACAVDELGAAGPYVTSETVTVNSGWVIVSGPGAEMGSKPCPFYFPFSVSVTGLAASGISVAVALDGQQEHTGTHNPGETIQLLIDTRKLGAGGHKIEVQAAKDDYLPAAQSYTFAIPALTLPDSAVIDWLENPDGETILPPTLARNVIGRDGQDVQAMIDTLNQRIKILEG